MYFSDTHDGTSCTRKLPVQGIVFCCRSSQKPKSVGQTDRGLREDLFARSSRRPCQIFLGQAPLSGHEPSSGPWVIGISGATNRLSSTNDSSLSDISTTWQENECGCFVWFQKQMQRSTAAKCGVWIESDWSLSGILTTSTACDKKMSVAVSESEAMKCGGEFLFVMESAVRLTGCLLTSIQALSSVSMTWQEKECGCFRSRSIEVWRRFVGRLIESFLGDRWDANCHEPKLVWYFDDVTSK